MGCTQSSSANTDAMRAAVAFRDHSRFNPTSVHAAPGSEAASQHTPPGMGGPISRSQLAHHRTIFWETQTSGSQAIWSCLRLAAEALQNADNELASSVLEAAEVRVMRGQGGGSGVDLSCCYDTLGHMYTVPRWLWVDPPTLVEDEELQQARPDRRSGATGGAGAAAATDLPVIFRIASSGPTLEQDVKMTVSSGASIGALKTKLHEHLKAGAADVPPDPANPGQRPNVWAGKGLLPARQRYMHKGRELKDDLLLAEARVSPGDFLQVFVRPESMGLPK